MTESQFSQKFRKRALELFPDLFIRKISSPWLFGVPDFVLVHNRWTSWVEVKLEGNEPTAKQLLCLKHLYREGGGQAYTLTVAPASKLYTIRDAQGSLILVTNSLDNVIKQFVKEKNSYGQKPAAG